jgi:hypothetical protein
MTQDGERQRVKEHLRTMLRKLISKPKQPPEPEKR